MEQIKQLKGLKALEIIINDVDIKVEKGVGYCDKMGLGR